MDVEIKFKVFLTSGRNSTEEKPTYIGQLCLVLNDGNGMGICMGRESDSEEEATNQAIIALGSVLQDAVQRCGFLDD